MPIDTELEKLIINKNISKSQFIEAYENGLIGDNDLSFVNDNTEYDIIVDDFISDTSENAVQNKVIKAYVDTTEQDIISGYMETDSELQQQINAQAIVIANKQDKLISGTNIKTINGESVVGSGDLDIKGSISVGIVLPFGGSTAPSGFLICDGSAISRTTYKDLFAVIGTTYGTGNGSTTFNLPNLTNAKLLKGSTIPVIGDGNALSVYDGLYTYGLTVANYNNHEFMGLQYIGDAYKKPAGTTGFSTVKDITNKAIGLTPRADYTTINADLSGGVAVKFIIKY